MLFYMTLVLNLFRHHRWANATLIDALGALPPEDLQRRAPGGFGTIHETLYHYVMNESRFIDALNSRDTSFGEMPSELPACQDLRAIAETNAQELLRMAAMLTEADRVEGNMQGRRYDLPAYVPLFQCYLHAAEHRTNITTILATYDLPAPNVDFWGYLAAGEPA